MFSKNLEISEHGVESVKLKQHLPYWQDVLTPKHYILDIIKNGYRLPFVSIPPNYSALNHSSTRDNVEFVTESDRELVQNGCAKLVLKKPLICSPLLVVKILWVRGGWL